MPYILPHIIEKDARSERQWDVFSRLLKDRIIFLGDVLDDFIANAIVAQLLYLQSQKRDADITLYINTPGGIVSAGFAVYDTMRYVTCDVATVCIGQAASMGSFLLAAGSKGKRFALPHSRIMLHQPSGGTRGQASDIDIQAREILRMKEEINRILSENTGQSPERIAKDVERDIYLSPQEALDYGLIDRVLARPGGSEEVEG